MPVIINWEDDSVKQGGLIPDFQIHSTGTMCQNFNHVQQIERSQTFSYEFTITE